jgi:hypothetical protein
MFHPLASGTVLGELRQPAGLLNEDKPPVLSIECGSRGSRSFENFQDQFPWYFFGAEPSDIQLGQNRLVGFHRPLSSI